MNTQFRIRGLNTSASLRAWLEQQLERLRRLTPVTAAEIVLERQQDSAPAFHAQVHLAVPGPDIHAEARDHTLAAVWLKVTTALRRQIERRKARQDSRMKGNGQVPARASRLVGSAAGRC